jgi:hypothetical protein
LKFFNRVASIAAMCSSTLATGARVAAYAFFLWAGGMAMIVGPNTATAFGDREESARPSAARGPVVRSIEVHYGEPLPKGEEAKLPKMRLQVGQPFSEEALDEDIRSFAKIHRFSPARIFGVPAGDGVAIIVVLRAKGESWNRADGERVDDGKPLPVSPAPPFSPEPLRIELPFSDRAAIARALESEDYRRLLFPIGLAPFAKRPVSIFPPSTR